MITQANQVGINADAFALGCDAGTVDDRGGVKEAVWRHVIFTPNFLTFSCHSGLHHYCQTTVM